MYRHLFVLLSFLTASAFAEQVELPRKPAERPRLKSIYSAEHDLAEMNAKGSRGIVFIFLNSSCPVARKYVPTLNQLHADFQRQGVEMYGIYPNASETVWEMAVHAHDADFPFPVFLDGGQKLAKLLDVTTTPEVVLVDAKWNRQYQGAIDDQFKPHGGRPAAIHHFLRDALTAMLAGQEVAENYMPPAGCPLERLEVPVSTQVVTYHRDVEPILQKSCQTCHRPGGVGPFELLTYEDAYYSAERIKWVVHERRMPPWHADLNPKFGKLQHDTRLSEQEIKTILSWDGWQSAPEGDPKDAPAAKKFPENNKWEIGKPDFVYQMPKPFKLPKDGLLEYQFFRVKLNFPEERWFNAVEVQPGNAAVVHHIGVHLVEASDKEFSGFSGMARRTGISTESAKLLNDYVPGDAYNAKIYPEGKAVRIPKHTDLMFELHYTPNGKEATDQSRIAFRWAAEPPEEEVLTRVFRKPVGRFRIPPNVSHFPMVDTYYFEEDVYLDAIRPHFHYRGKSFRLEMVTRDEQTDEIVSRDTVLSVPVFDQGWQRTYELETSLFVPAGTELIATANFDNSKFNPKNPNPEATVLWGQQTNDEMFSTRFKYHAADPKPVKR